MGPKLFAFNTYTSVIGSPYLSDRIPNWNLSKWSGVLDHDAGVKNA